MLVYTIRMMRLLNKPKRKSARSKIFEGVLGKRLLAYLLLFSSFVTFVASSFILYRDYQKELGQKEAYLVQIEKSYLPSLAQSLWDFDLSQVRLQLNGIRNFPYIVYAEVVGTLGKVERAGAITNDRNLERYEFPLTHSEDEELSQVGHLAIVIDMNVIYGTVLDKAIVIIISQFFKTIVISLFILIVVHQLVTRHMEALARWAQQADLEVPVKLKRNTGYKDELDHVVDSINNMRKLVIYSIEQRDEAFSNLEELNKELEAKVDERTEELLEVIENLNESFENLKNTRRQLVEAEKMAQLGALVAGVAHELNTPLGVCVTSCSHIDGVIEEIDHKVAQGNITKQDFVVFISQLQEALHLLTDNVGRATRIVQSFKGLAVKKSTESKVRQNLKLLIEQVTIKQGYTTHAGLVEFSIECDEALEITTYSGTLEAVLTSLIGNTLDHGYTIEDEIHISIKVVRENQFITIHYRDGGKGIDDEVRSHIFEPFYTTARYKGNVGLGLHMTYNLTTQILNGTIHCLPAEQGAYFTVRIPLDVDSVEHAISKETSP